MVKVSRRNLLYFTISAVVIVIISFIFIFEKVTIRAAEGAFIDQEWVAILSSPLLDEGSEPANLFITNDQNKKIDAKIKVDEIGKTIRVSGLEKGTYTLHLNKKFIEGKPFKRLSKEQVTFKIFETLESVNSEEELTNYFEQVQLTRSEKQEALEAIEESSTNKDSASDDASAESHSETNTQVEGVDEADIVKTDGAYIYSILGNTEITVTDIRNPAELKIATTIPVDDDYYPTQLFLHEQMLIVLGDKYVAYEENRQVSKRTRLKRNEMTTVRLYDISKPEQPELIREIGTEGYLNSARKTGDYLYYVTNMHPNYWAMEELDHTYLRPGISDSNEGEEMTPLAYEDIAILPGTMESTYSVITAVDLSSAAQAEVLTKGYLGGSEQLYMSKDNLYLTATNYELSEADSSATDSSWRGGSGNTEVFKFGLSQTDVTFASSAQLQGSLLNQFSMDEYQGNFRAVTTDGDMWDERNMSTNNLFIFDEKMNQIGSVENLAKGERIYSARFMGDKAYMVTFRETDPLFVIDVADPTAPEVLGELKIPGFSNYLHPLDENHLIGFGYETAAEKSEQGKEPIITTLGMKISLFDVSDFHNPKEKDTEIIGGKGTYSQIQYDHKALFLHRDRNLYGFPIEIYEETKKSDNDDYVGFQNTGALIYEITPENGIVLKGDLLGEETEGEQYADYEQLIERILYSKDSLYTVSAGSIKSYSLDTFAPIDELPVTK